MMPAMKRQGLNWRRVSLSLLSLPGKKDDGFGVDELFMKYVMKRT
eukprot:CAMPEP_0206408512 /NCGR_PEP_ID=MMETSP0294-20121207/31208_1 /ASSEMBLY_ACC=CAM_ASM_000327 /TAXON_ID=39354 /ORGANISM="Heterosigma akashiwo, Strain CCMP2393" /LENGTH=44 /DNA_ID= /DNA_START= /DNA_END= /DNA_ORIENTATION=